MTTVVLYSTFANLSCSLSLSHSCPVRAQVVDEGDGTVPPELQDDDEVEEREPTEIHQEGVELIASYW